MTHTAFIFVSIVLLLLPVLVKYALAFEIRGQVLQMRKLERAVQRLSAQWEAVQSESIVVRRALRQIELQRRQALGRKAALTERLDRLQPREGATRSEVFAA